MSDRDDIIAHHAAGTLPQLFVERLRRHRADELGIAFRATLTGLHNDGTIDVLEPARQIASSSIDQHQFFTVMHVYTDLIPTLEAEVLTMLAAVKALVARAGNDGAAGMPNGAYRTWAEQGDRARATLAAIDPDDAEDSAYVYLGLQALAKSEPEAALHYAITYLAGTSAPTRSAAAKAIGTFALATPEARRQAADALGAAAPTADDNSLGHILTAICELARAHSDMAADAAALIDASTSQAGDQAIHQLSLEFMFHAEELPAEIVAGLTEIMHRVPIANRGTIENIDAAGGMHTPIDHRGADPGCPAKGRYRWKPPTRQLRESAAAIDEGCACWGSAHGDILPRERRDASRADQRNVTAAFETTTLVGQRPITGAKRTSPAQPNRNFPMI